MIFRSLLIVAMPKAPTFRIGNSSPQPKKRVERGDEGGRGGG